MHGGADHHEPWAIRLPGDEAVRKPGQNLQQWAGDERGGARRAFDRLTLRELKDPKLAGAWGEERVGRELAKLGDEWTALHGVRVGRRADVDHLVLGPAGVFSLNTKHLDVDAKVVVSARRFRVNGYSRDYYPKAVREAERVAERLEAAVGAAVSVTPVLVVAGVDLKNYRVKAQPEDVAVVTRREVCRWLTDQPRRLSPGTLAQLTAKARHPATWDPSKVAEILDVQPDRQAADRLRVEGPIGAPAPDLTGVTVARWRRYGHDRLYVNDTASGARLGWRDQKTGAVRVQDGADAAVVEAALRAWDATPRP
jgi:hypothetical protein